MNSKSTTSFALFTLTDPIHIRSQGQIRLDIMTTPAGAQGVQFIEDARSGPLIPAHDIDFRSVN
jgi:hypothetical protein